MTVAREPVLILGAGSDIGRALARRFARAGHAIQLAARDAERLAADRDDLHLRYQVPVSVHAFDALEPGSFEPLLQGLAPFPGIAISVVGLMGEQEASEHDAALAETVMRANYVGPALLLQAIANRYAEAGAGTVVGVSSVAGDRGRAANYVYGSAKAGFTAYLSGLRARLHGRGVRVITVKPGFVRTRMTEGMALPGALVTSPEAVADAVHRAVVKGRDEIYCGWYWRWIMWVIRALPERLFKRTRF